MYQMMTLSPGLLARSLAVLATFCCLYRCADAADTSSAARVTLITSQHSNNPYRDYGGWAPHLGHLIEMRGQLWFIDGDGYNSASNYGPDWGVSYYKLASQQWQRLDRQGSTNPALPEPIHAHVGQRAGTIVGMDDVAYTYAMRESTPDTPAQSLIECNFDPVNPNWGDQCHSVSEIVVPSGSNYIGAAVFPKNASGGAEGAKVVWWTIPAKPTGQICFVFNYWSATAHRYLGFNGPFCEALPMTFTDASYAKIGFDPDRGRYWIFAYLTCGLGGGATPSGVGIAMGQVGTTPKANAWSITPFDPDTCKGVSAQPEDLWVNPTNGDVHVLVQSSSSGQSKYFYSKGDSQSQPGMYQFVQVAEFLGTFARFVAPMGPRLFVAYGSSCDKTSCTPLHFRWDSISQSPFDWCQHGEYDIGLGLYWTNQIDGIWPESAAYQGVRPSGFSLAVHPSDSSRVLHAYIEAPPSEGGRLDMDQCHIGGH